MELNDSISIPRQEPPGTPLDVMADILVSDFDSDCSATLTELRKAKVPAAQPDICLRQIPVSTMKEEATKSLA